MIYCNSIFLRFYNCEENLILEKIFVRLLHYSQDILNDELESIAAKKA